MAGTVETPKERRWSWLFWWQIDPVELERQTAEYDTLGRVRSIRGQAVGCLLFSIAITVAFVYFGRIDQSAYYDAGLMAVLAVFIYLGHRWAMIAAMVLWTVEKGIGVTDTLNGPVAPASGPNILLQVIWWCIYMHAFYFSFRVEQEKKKCAAIPGAA